MHIYEFIKRNPWAILLGTFIRFIFAPFTGHHYDLPIWLISGELLANGQSPYDPYDHIGQTILTAIWPTFAYLLTFSINVFQPFLYIFAIKLLYIFADLIVVYTVVRILQNHQVIGTLKQEQKIVWLLYLNPVIIIVSSFWAMADSVAILCILWSYLFIYKQQWLLSAGLLVIAIGLKLYPVVLVPVFLLYLLEHKNGWRNALLFGFGVVFGFFFVSYFPFLITSWDVGGINGVLISQTQRNFGAMSNFVLFEFIMGNLLPKSWYIDFASIEIVKYLWLLQTGTISLVLLYGQQVKKRKLFGDQVSFLALLCVYYLQWVLTASWISEQNFTPLLILVFLLYFLKFNQFQPKIRNLFVISYLLGSLVVLVFISVNVPFPAFFYPIFPSALNILGNANFLAVEFQIKIAMLFVNLILIIYQISIFTHFLIKNYEPIAQSF